MLNYFELLNVVVYELKLFYFYFNNKKEIINHQKNVLNNPNISISLSPQTQKYKENDAQVPKSKKMFKIPNALKPTQVKFYFKINVIFNYK